MFVLERLFRGLVSEDNQERTAKLFSQYDELLGKIKDFRSNKRTSEYHERLRLIVWPYLIESVNKMKASHYTADDIKIFLLARDHLIIIKDEKVDWIGIVKNLMEAKEFGLIVRVLRYLKLEKVEILGNISLLLLNTLNKMLGDAESSLKDISFVLQVIKLLNFNEIDGDEMLKNNLLKMLRSERLNDRLKAMIIKICDEQVMEMINEESLKSAVIRAALTEKGFETSGKVQISSSKLINLINGNYEKFSEIERAILEDKSITNRGISSYEKYLLALGDTDINDVIGDCELVDPNVLRHLLKIDKLSSNDFIKQIPNNLSLVDYELIKTKTYDFELFWKCLNSSDFISLDGLEIKPYMKDYMMNKDIRSLTLPAQVYFFKLLNNSEDDYDEYLKSVANDLYEKYKDNFDGSGLIFKEFINKNNKSI